MKVRKHKHTTAKATQPARLTTSKAIQKELMAFIEYHPAKRFSTNLRTMLIDFLMFEGATESNYLMDLLYDLDGLFKLLEAIQTDSEST